MGLLVGLVAAPCIGPVVVALIGVVGASRSVGLGAITLFALGMGLAVPYLALGFGLIKALPRAGEWLVAMKRIFGLLLFGMGIYYLRPLLGSTVYRYVFSLYGVMAGAYLILLDKTAQNHAKFLAFKRGVGACAIALGIYAFEPSAGDATKTAIAFVDVADFNAFQSRLVRARADGKNVLVDFGATWCAACTELDEETFHNAGVVKATGEYISLRVDLTDFDGDRAKPFRALFDIAGLPTIVHLTPESSRASTRTDQAYAK
jgi:thiol:disulfide interchange protein DsbD